MLAREDGPADIFMRIRNMLGVEYNQYAEAYGTNIASKAILCVWCSSIWIAIVPTIGYIFSPFITVIACLPFSISALAILFDNYYGD